jgi:hypothetical protein
VRRLERCVALSRRAVLLLACSAPYELVVGDAQGGLWAWSAAAGSKPRAVLPAEPRQLMGGRICRLAACGPGRPSCVLVGNADGSLVAVDAAGGQVLAWVQAHRGLVQSLQLWGPRQELLARAPPHALQRGAVAAAAAGPEAPASAGAAADAASSSAASPGANAGRDAAESNSCASPPVQQAGQDSAGQAGTAIPGAAAPHSAQQVAAHAQDGEGGEPGPTWVLTSSEDGTAKVRAVGAWPHKLLGSGATCLQQFYNSAIAVPAYLDVLRCLWRRL